MRQIANERNKKEQLRYECASFYVLSTVKVAINTNDTVDSTCIISDFSHKYDEDGYE